MDFREPPGTYIIQYGSFNPYSITFSHFMRFIIFNLLFFFNRQQKRAVYTSFLWKTCFWGMFGVFLTAIPLAIFKINVFLLLIAIFSFYLAFAEMRFAINRKGIPKLIDRIALILICCSGIAMLLLG